jgi:DNA-binding MarR family transcriptional regulator
MDADVALAGELIRLATGIQYIHQCVAREFDLTAQQALMMCPLVEEPLGMAKLTEALHIEKSTLTGLVDRAERRGLVRRIPDADDRRALRVELTPEGREVAVAFEKQVTAHLLRYLDDLPCDVVAGLRSVLPQVAAAYWTGPCLRHAPQAP